MQERFTISPQRFTQLAWFTLGLLVVVVVTGAGVRLTRSGLGCPDWPTCHGSLNPPSSLAYGALRLAWIEHSHRLWAALLIGLVVFAVLVAIGAPPLARLILVVPITVAASGYLQARLRFCAGFGSRGIFNFGPVGTTQTVADPEALARDRARARQIGLASFAIGAAVAIVAVLLPV